MSRMTITSMLVIVALLALVELTLAQTVSSPVDANSDAILIGNYYIYNPATASIISPVAGGTGFAMIPWQYYDNTTMQWTVSLYGSGPTYGISAQSPQAAGCDSSATAQWNAPKKSPVSALCTPAVSVYTNFIFIPTTTANTFSIVPYSNAAACVTILNGVPSSPATACNRLGQYTQWQFVTIG